MNRDEFIRQFVTSFLATWCANNYTDYCMRSMQEELANPPIEDAIHLAEEAWEVSKDLYPIKMVE